MYYILPDSLFLILGIYSFHIINEVHGLTNKVHWMANEFLSDRNFTNDILYAANTRRVICARTCSMNDLCLSWTYAGTRCTCFGSRKFIDTNYNNATGSKYYERAPQDTPVPIDCNDLKTRGMTTGVHTIYPEGPNSGIQVLCDMDSDPDSGLIVLQNRYDGSVDFYQNWATYKSGFGVLNGEFWLGNDNIHLLTKSGNYAIRVDLEDTYGNKRYAEYQTFIVQNEADNYRLSIGIYSGDLGDSKGFSYNNGYQFSTYDKDVLGRGCPDERKSGWWFDYCTWVNMNGLWIPGTSAWSSMMWYNWKVLEGMKKTSMKLKRKI